MTMHFQSKSLREIKIFSFHKSFDYLSFRTYSGLDADSVPWIFWSTGIFLSKIDFLQTQDTSISWRKNWLCETVQNKRERSRGFLLTASASPKNVIPPEQILRHHRLMRKGVKGDRNCPPLHLICPLYFTCLSKEFP